jgi:hypothetical protein
VLIFAVVPTCWLFDLAGLTILALVSDIAQSLGIVVGVASLYQPAANSFFRSG